MAAPYPCGEPSNYPRFVAISAARVMSVSRAMPRHIVVIPGGASRARAR